ncbi:heptaprenyl diphosphate synthase [Actinobaculum suis]|uniref:Heptaprenyl diphosphate synthase n=1 Tax=Actinobaculum suis TaxID=1657 RepID=A0A1G7CBK1_9ACTO|nr:polyprenyl synthetase family protein [Actinobaculum suis]MDY5152951.1 polyprenyl synthetase family protein [Actinobaculum suis]SDE36603.1 heptaprenyl diphosphate synthase [Actinobaculum suis]
MSQTNATVLTSRVEERLAKVERLLDTHASLDDLRVAAMTTYLQKAGGKRLRPALTLLCSYLGPNPEDPQVEQVAAAIELTHLASLYHDDVMDDAPYRRGKPAAQVVFGNSAAILAGDILFARANALMANLSPRAVHDHSVTFARLCRGQLSEWLGPEVGDPENEFSQRSYYLQVLADKTGSLIAAAAREGVYAAGGTAQIARVVEEFGEKIGVAFQLTDDYIDVMSDSTELGKTAGTDVREGVDTMPTILLRERQAAGELDSRGQRILELVDAARQHSSRTCVRAGAALAGAASTGLADAAPAGAASAGTASAGAASAGAASAGTDLASGMSDAELQEAVELLRGHAVMEETLAMARQWCAEAIAALAAIPEAEIREALASFAWSAVERNA